MKKTRSLRIVSAFGLVGCLVAGLVGCGTSSDASDTGNGGAADRAGRTGYPFTLDNCGVQVTFDKAPARAVSLYQASTEILLSLGLADRMVGTSTWFDPVLPNLTADNAKVPRLADNDPSLEAVLAKEPDLVTSASAHTFTPAVVAERSRFAQLGIPTYQSPSVCTGAIVEGETVTRTAPLGIDTLFQEITELARIFDVQERGAQLVDQLRGRLQAATAQAQQARTGAEPTVAFWFSGVKTPYLAGCCSAPGLYAREVGARNVFADQREDWPEISWEAVVAADPEVLVLADLSRKRIEGDALATKIEFLESNPATNRMRAVQNKRYVVMTGSELDPGIREIDAIEKLAAGLAGAR
ncbi:ABC transporter substrate-binding protein [Nocardia sp. 2]|uniref:ABC transporter substrate-binding protein n=1 Tax=Nocardia acididurans TaxID=2802282 RepID=A0ABS1MJV4_9NOCA|nr:ABC transporter substrate-binding protein [Nocardia acididurans]MBL1080325.1 ABC transporter substrate-binding protein [Nocardia acididurans]